MATYSGKGQAARAKSEPMSEGELIAIIEDRERRADASRPDKEYFGDAIEYYMGEGNDPPAKDRSGIVMMELFSVIEWIKPVLAKIFFGGPAVVRFSPKSAEDVEQAEQETDYINHVILDQNDGFASIFNWFTDAMLSRNAYMFAYWDKREDTTESEYEDQTLEQVAVITADPNVELIESSARDIVTAEGVETLYTVKVRTIETKGRVCLETVPPERVRIDSRHRKTNLADCPFVEYYEQKTISELREAGFDIPDDIQDDGDSDTTGDSATDHRRKAMDETVDDDDDMDPASRVVTIRTMFMRVDYDGDGIAELRRVMVIGKTIVYNDTDDIITLACLSPITVPHRHTGMSFFDIVKQLQDLKTQLARGLVDNVNLANNGRWFLSENVDIDDFLNGRPNAPVRVSGDSVAGQAMPFNHPLLGNQIIGTLEYADSVMENWTGASPRSLQGQNFDGNSINKTASGISQIMSAAVARIELVARIFAETGMRELFRIIHALTLQHANKAVKVQLRGKWVEVDPTTWERRDSITIDSGLGTGDRSQKIQTLQSMITAQTTFLTQGVPVTDVQRLSNSLRKLAEEMGYKDPDQFWIDPSQQEGEQPKGLEALLPAQRQAVLEQVKGMVDEQMKARQAELKAQSDAMGYDTQLKQALLTQETASETNMRDNLVRMAMAAMKSDDDKLAAGAELAAVDGMPMDQTRNKIDQLDAERAARAAAPPKQKRVVHNYDAQGRIISSDLVEA